MAESPTVYDFSYVDIDGKEQSLEKYRNKVLIIVNVASQCGYTKSNYEDLSELYDKYKDQGLSVLGFPCSQFGNQEPGTEEEIKNFVCTRFKASFDMAKKVDVNGSNAHPLFVFLKKQQGGTFGDFIKWNFTKFVVNKKGQVVKRYGPSTNPKEFEGELVKLLKE